MIVIRFIGCLLDAFKPASWVATCAFPLGSVGTTRRARRTSPSRVSASPGRRQTLVTVRARWRKAHWTAASDRALTYPHRARCRPVAAAPDHRQGGIRRETHQSCTVRPRATARRRECLVCCPLLDAACEKYCPMAGRFEPGCAALADLMAVRAIDDDRSPRFDGGDPVLDVVRIAPVRPDDHLSARRRFEASGHPLPLNVLHERVHVGRSLCAVVHVIRVLVHVESQDRRGTRQRMRMVGSPLVDQSLVSRGVSEQHPARAATQRLAHRREFGLPARNRAEIAFDGILQPTFQRPAITEAVEVHLVQDHRIRGDQFLALQAIEHEHRCGCHIECGQFSRDRVQSLHGTTVVVLVVADDQLLRQTGKLGRVTRQWLQLIGHDVFSHNGVQWCSSGYAAKPIRAAPATITGSDSFLNFSSSTTVTTASSAVGISTIERLASTITAPVMAPMAAAVTPSTNARIAGSLPYFLKYGAGKMVKR
ncbi:hypothetical protein COLO4_01454 [Corchorus olitorius]|uniref:Uncharacterized protein n=1 Tax=Corchorus olitorius TaxID=93759 RepID=A0A1R3L2G1_9ROSI|nr:hypothetical protein COLO4_01454 [Corchorus olitorius]